MDIYQKVRIEIFTDRNIRAGWKRAGLYPSDINRILQDPRVTNYERYTPDLTVIQPPQGIYSTPHKVREFEAVRDLINAKSTPHTRRYIQKLFKGAIKELSRADLVSDEIKTNRKRQHEEEMDQRSKKIQKEVN